MDTMKKRAKRLFLVNSVIFEIFILVCMSFAIAFIWSESVGVASAAQVPAAKEKDLAQNQPPPQEEKKDDTTGEIISGGQMIYQGYGMLSGGKEGAAAAAPKAPPTTPTPTPVTTPPPVAPVAPAAPAATSATWGSIAGTWLSALGTGLFWGALVYGVVKMVGGMTGEDPGVVNSIANAAGAGFFVGATVYSLLTTSTVTASGAATGTTALGTSVFAAGAAFAWAFGIGLVIAAIIYVVTYERQKEGQVVFTCETWSAPSGGKNCEQCNNDPFRPCSEYRCRSLGAGCEIINQDTAKEACVYVAQGDVVSPTITPWEEALKPSELKYTDVNTRPPSLGMKIVQEDGSCLKAFTPLEFGINTNEPSQCRIDYNMTNNFEDMKYSFGESDYYEYNHTQRMLLPNFNTTGEQSPLLSNDGTFTLYTRCRDKTGNFNVDAFAIAFCVDASPDTTPPIIHGTSIKTGSAVAYKVVSSPIELYTNEPSECRWDWSDRAYEEMAYNMSCTGSPLSINANLQYACGANLTGIRTDGTSDFYFRCRDQPWFAGTLKEKDRNTNQESYKLLLASSKPLNIISLEPNGSIFGSSEVVKSYLRVRTSAGAKDGEATCMFSDSGESGSFIVMAETGKAESSQELNLIGGDYTVYIRCYDSAGNLAEKSISFNVEVDREAPAASRVYRENGLKIVTNEDAECVYSLNNCNYNFAEGLAMQNSNPSIKTIHYAEMKGNAIYYIKCKDGYGNEPLPNECSIVVNSAS